MTSEGNGNGKAPPPEERQWALALAYLRRAEESADYLRLLLFVAAGAFIIFLLPEIKAGQPRTLLYSHIAAISLCAFAMCLLVHAWQSQTEKARERFKYLRANDYDNYLQYDSAVEKIGGRHNTNSDWIAFGCLLAVLLIELAVRYLSSVSTVNV